jgi:prolipoprotein diacylglyceryl transferase
MHVLATIPPPPGNVIELGPLTVHYYGIAIAIGVLIAITVVRKRYEAMGGDPELADRVCLWTVGLGFVGARIGYVLPRLDRFAGDPLSAFAVWEGGLVFFGGLFAGTVAAVVLIRRWGGDLPAFADAVAPAIPLAQAFGRWGNYFNQELFGTSTDLPWALEIERGGVIVDTVHPTFLYEMLGNLVIVAALIVIGRRTSLRRGSLMFAYAMGYGVLRFLMELIRTDERAFTFILTANAWVSVLVFAIGLAGIIWWNRRDEPLAATPGPDGEPLDATVGPDDEPLDATVGPDDATFGPDDGAAPDDDAVAVTGRTEGLPESQAGAEPAPGSDDPHR